jgi:hypothetical protein
MLFSPCRKSFWQRRQGDFYVRNVFPERWKIVFLMPKTHFRTLENRFLMHEMHFRTLETHFLTLGLKKLW